jgi:hypothetical protein
MASAPVCNKLPVNRSVRCCCNESTAAMTKPQHRFGSHETLWCHKQDKPSVQLLCGAATLHAFVACLQRRMDASRVPRLLVALHALKRPYHVRNMPVSPSGAVLTSRG